MQPNSRIAEALVAFKRGELARARALAQAQLEAEQGPPEVDHLLGLIECREGRMESGIAHLTAALDAQPDNAAFRVMLARALVDGGRPQEALEIAVAPREPSAEALALWHVRAEAAQAAGNHVAAAEAWSVVSAARPDDWRSWANYGDSLAASDRWAEAANALRRAVDLNPADAPLRENFATALARAGFYNESADELKRLLDGDPDDIRIRIALASLYANLGREEDSMAELDKAARQAEGDGATGSHRGLIRIAMLDGDVPDVTAVRELASLLERTSRMDALRTLLDEAEALGVGREEVGYPAAAIALRDGDAKGALALLEASSADDDSVRRNRLLGKIRDSLGDAAGAFAAAEAMNRSVHEYAHWRSRGADYRMRLRALAETITPEWAEQLKPLAAWHRRSPAFLVGFPRSGTTLLDTFLMGHPDTTVLEEVHMLGAAETVLGHIAGLPHRSRVQLEQARRAYFAEMDKHVPPDFAGLVVDKLPLNMLGLPAIYAMFPDARIIFAQRHPCDCVLSGFMQSFTMNDAMACFLHIGDAAELYDAAMRVFTRSRDALPLAHHTLAYERLVAGPEAVLRPLVDFLGLEWKPELLDHRSTAKARGAIITPSYDQVVEPLSRAPSGRWRRYEKQLEPVLPVLLPWAERLGYAD